MVSLGENAKIKKAGNFITTVLSNRKIVWDIVPNFVAFLENLHLTLYALLHGAPMDFHLPPTHLF